MTESPKRDDFRDDLMRALDYFGKTDDRSLAIVSASYCEKYVGELIAARLPALTRKLRNVLLDRTLQAAKTRYKMAEAMGILKPELRRDLEYGADIRNLFAHNLEIDSFDHPSIAAIFDKIEPPKMADTGEVFSGWYVHGRRGKAELIFGQHCLTLHNGMNTAFPPK